jgi:hypothetical protein
MNDIKATKPKRIQRKRIKAWKMPPNTISVCRPGTWGNPHKVEGRITDFDAVAMFEDDLINMRLKDRKGTPLLLRVHELRGKNLACFCKEKANCHGDILLAYANSCWPGTPDFVWLSIDEDGDIAVTESEVANGVKYVSVPTDILAPKYKRILNPADWGVPANLPRPPREIYIEKDFGGRWFVL